MIKDERTVEETENLADFDDLYVYLDEGNDKRDLIVGLLQALTDKDLQEIRDAIAEARIEADVNQRQVELYTIVGTDNRDLNETQVTYADTDNNLYKVSENPMFLFKNAVANHGEEFDWIEDTPDEDILNALREWKKEVDRLDALHG